MFNIMNLNNIENIFYWTDNNGAVYLPGDTALTYRTKSDLPRFVAAVYSALNVVSCWNFWNTLIRTRALHCIPKSSSDWANACFRSPDDAARYVCPKPGLCAAQLLQ